MGTERVRIGVVALVLAGALSSSPPAYGAGSTPFAPLGVVLPHTVVTALAIGAHGTIYAGGRYLIPVNDPTLSPPVLVAGSVWAVSHDHGAHWVAHISATTQTPPTTQLWRNHAVWPDAFTANSIAVDPTNPRVLYAAGCMSDEACAGSSGGHVVLRSTDGGTTWHDALRFGRFFPHGNLVLTPLLAAVLRRGGTQLTQAYAVAVDSHNGRRVYACVSGLGMVRSDDGTRTWRYTPQPPSLGGHCELLIDPVTPRVVYSLDRQNRILYRTTNGGASWSLRSAFAQDNQRALVLSGLTLVGRTLYLTGLTGIYVSTDGGAHWRLTIRPPGAGGMGPSIRASDGWITAFVPRSNAQPEGLYEKRDGGPWQLAVTSAQYGMRYYGPLDVTAFTAGNSRLWEDHTVRVVFTAAQTGGLYRWRSDL